MSSRSRSSSVLRRWSWTLALLCLVQSCERFAFLAMLPMFVLYAHDRIAMSAPTALMVLAIFQALSFLGGLPAGWLSDHRLGPRGSKGSFIAQPQPRNRLRRPAIPRPKQRDHRLPLL